MNASRTTTVQENRTAPNDESRPGFRTKTISMRVTADELTEVESAAERARKPLSEWLREAALTAARQRPADPIELVLAEIWAVYYAMLRLFHAGAEATNQGKPLLSESVLKIRDKTDRQKLEQARRMLTDFLARPVGENGEVR